MSWIKAAAFVATFGAGMLDSTVFASPLLNAIAQVESGGNAGAINKQEQAYGMYQITPLALKDVNNILRSQGNATYTLNDMLEPAKAKYAATVYLQYWGSRYRVRTKQLVTEEVLTRIWNGGPFGYRKKATLDYWERVQNILYGGTTDSVKN